MLTPRLRTQLTVPFIGWAMVLVGMAQPNQVIPNHDPRDVPFRRAPMGLSSRSIVVSVATNLHVAFDAKLLRTHTVWKGESLNLFGPPYNDSANPFICHYTGARLWGNPPFHPWSVGSIPNADLSETSASADFKGIGTKGGRTTFIYDVAVGDAQTVRVHETPMSDAAAGRQVVVRRFEVAPSGQDLWLLAHAELGGIGGAGSPPAATIKRQGDLLLAIVRGAKGVTWHPTQIDVHYSVTVDAEKGGKGPDSAVITNTVEGKEARLYLKISAHTSNVVFEIASLVCQSNDEVVKIVPMLTNAPVKPPQMQFLTGKEKSESTTTPKIFPPDSSFIDHPGGDEFYRVEHFPIPKEVNLRVGGMDFLPNGDLAICTLPGEVWIVEDPTNATTQAKWRRFARGLNEPMGLKVIDGQIHVTQKCELTRLIDTDGNGESDLFANISDDWGYNGNYHSFATGPVVDSARNLYVMLTSHRGAYDVPYLGWCVQLKPGMKNEKLRMKNADDNVVLLSDRFAMEGFCSGLRVPNGCGVYQGDVFATDNQGHWIAANKLNHLQGGRFYGHPSSKPSPIEQFNGDTNFAPPTVWFPYAWVESASDITTINDERFGLFKGQMLVGEFQNANVVRVALEKVNGEWQGAVFPFVKGFNSGVNRFAFGPDGKLYVGGLRMGHWTSIAPQPYSLDRVSFTGQVTFEIKEVHAMRDGFELSFTQPVDAATAGNLESYDASQYNYGYHGSHGGPENDKEAKVPGPAVRVTKAEVSSDGIKVRLKVEGCQAGYVVMVRAFDVMSADGKKLWHDTFHYTLNLIPKD